MIEQIVPKILKMFVKLIIYVFIFFAILNIFCFLYNFPRLSSISKMVSHSAEKNGFIPYEDYVNIQSYIDAYSYQSKNAETVLNINKVVTNLKMVVYDLDNHGHPESLHDYTYTGDELYFIDSSNSDYTKQRKKQSGSVLIAGISCDYMIIHPLNGWAVFNLVQNHSGPEISKESINNISTPYTNVSRDTSLIYEDNTRTRELGYTTFNTFNILNRNTSSSLNTSLFLEPVITTQYYPDKDTSSGSLLTGG